jgi:DNA-binding HxlR family transcriptional regulator
MNPKKDIEPKRTFDEYAEMGSSKANLFGHNFSARQAYKRTERIVAALYLLTKNVPYTEPIREAIRSKGHELIHEALSLKSSFGSRDSMVVFSVASIIRELISLSRMLFIGGYISRNNAEILTKALDDLAQFVLAAGGSSVSEDTLFSSNDFSPIRSELRANQDELSSSAREGDVRLNILDSKIRAKKVTKKAVARTIAREDRRTLVLDTLRRGGKLGIKDISIQVVGFSEKTVQRELINLVNEGIIRKEGEKRWSKYSLI